MAKSNFNFNTTLKLNSSGFKKGVKEVQGMLSSLKNSFLSVAGALGAGLGFTQLITSLKDTATQLSVAKNTLRNVSNETITFNNGVKDINITVDKYAENLEYVKRLSKDYSQDLIALTSNFAQFHASCMKTSLGLEEQKYIYEALTRAAAYYHMSADRTKDMMNAITQMMSKGKIAAEELRRQLGNALPGAFNLMASAMGVSTAELDKLMRDGKVISSEVLPKFAAMLNTVTQNADFNSLQMSMNNLKNSWTNMVNDHNFEGFFKGIVDNSTNAVNYINKNFNSIKDTIVGVAIAIGSIKLFDKLKLQGEKFLKEQEKIVKQTGAQIKKIDLEEFSKTLPADYNSWSTDQINELKKYIDLAKKYENAKKNLTLDNSDINIDIKSLKDFEKVLKKLPNYVDNTNKSFKGVNKTILTIRSGLISIGKTILSFIKANALLAILSVVASYIYSIWDRLTDIREEASRISNIFSDYQKNAEKLDTAVESQKTLLESQARIMQDGNNALFVRLKAYQEIKNLIGASDDVMPNISSLKELEGQYNKVTEAVKGWIEQLQIKSKLEYYTNQQSNAAAKIQELEAKKAEIIEKRRKEAKTITKKAGGNLYGSPVKLNPIEQENYAVGKNIATTDFEGKELQNINNELEQLNKLSSDAKNNIDSLNVEIKKLDTTTQNNNSGGDTQVKGLAKVLKDYQEEKQELINQLKEGAIVQEAFNKEMDNLAQKYFKYAASTGEIALSNVIEKINKGQLLSSMEQLYYDISQSAKKAAINVLVDEVAKAMEKAMNDNIKEAMQNIDDSLEKYKDYFKDTELELDVADVLTKPTKKDRNKLFDFDKSNSSILGEKLDIENQYISDLQSNLEKLQSTYDQMAEKSDLIKEGINEYSKALTIATKNAKNLEQAMNFASIQEKIDDIKKNINKTAYSGFKDLANSADRVMKAFQEISEVNSEPDASGWEKFIAVWNATIQVADTLIGIFDTINTIMELSQTLTSAKVSQETLLNTQLGIQKGLQEGMNAEKEKEVITDLASASAKKIDTAASIENTAAKSGLAIAGATESGSKLPFPYNLVAIAAGVAAVIAALASISKFANGGIIGGTSTSGDKQIARVNSGEMILNKQQQANLFSMINSGKGAGGEVQFKIRGTDLVGVMNNAKSARHM